MWIGEQLLHQRIGHVELRQDTRAAKPALPAAALTQFARAIDDAYLLRGEPQSFFARSGQVARNLEKRDHLHVGWKILEDAHLLDVHGAPRHQLGQRIARNLAQARKALLADVEPDSVGEKKDDCQCEQSDLHQHHDVEETLADHDWPCLSTVRTLCIRTGTLNGLAM